MKILVVDDNLEKIRKVVQGILSVPQLSRDDIDVVQNGQDARAKLKACTYDLLVLDLCLPDWPESEPDISCSLSLVSDIIDNSVLNRPRQIVGLSMFDDMIQTARPEFDQYLWTILHYTSESDDWQSGIIGCIKYLLSDAAPDDLIEPVDLCIVTALYHPELTALLNIDWNWQVQVPLDDTTFVNKGFFYCEGKAYTVVAAHAARMGMVASSLLSAKLIAACKPKFLVMTGICAGLREKTNYGDAILANPTWDYQCGKRTETDDGPYFYIAPHQISVPENIEVRFQALSRDFDLLSSLKRGWQGEKPESELKLVCGPVASGSAVLADQNSVNQVKSQLRTLVGIEMEIYGVYAAGSNAPSPRPVTFAVKSVCDHADPEKDDRFQKYAAYTSVSIVKAFFERYMKEIVDVH
ncbi:response regulator [Pseudomonas syringae]|uniref:Response regulatory domain-containing protein n=1 Tax=Pseudomonas syringae TaxID=317 RepID=A0A085V693_PSESX|nr:response regulator [Pseudomonas syringae]KFE50956.1 hypothetical protein IV02_16235 [Pseudomonas syringae]